MSENQRRGLVPSWHGLRQTHFQHAAGSVLADAVKGHEDGASVSLGQLRGSHAIAQLSDLVVALQRDISAGDNRSELVVLKNRFNGQTGPAGKLSYGLETGRLTQALFDATDSPSPAPTSYDDF